MITKKSTKWLLAILPVLLLSSRAYSMEDMADWLWQNARDEIGNMNVRDQLQFVGDITRGVGQFSNDMAEEFRRKQDRIREKQKREFEDQKRILKEKVMDTHFPKDVRDGYAKQLLDLETRDQRAAEKHNELQQKLMNDAADMYKNTYNTVLEQGKAHLDHGREKERIAIQSAQERKAKVDVARAYAKETTDFVKNNPGLLIGLAAGVSGAYYAAKYTSQYIYDQYQLPTLAQETSLLSTSEKAKNYITGVQAGESSLADVILEEKVAEQINEVAESLGNIVKNGSVLPNICLWGPPGTGKTMVAMRLARSCGLDYIYFAASSLDQFSTEEAIKHITELFEHAKKTTKKLMIIMDEAEVALVQRSPNLPEKTRKIITHLLTYTGTESRDYMIVIMTNRPEDLDEAVLSRLDSRIFIGKPAPVQRRAILKQYVTKYLVEASHLQQTPSSVWSYWFSTPEPVKKAVIADEILTDKYLDQLSARLEGFTGRDISKLVLAMLNSAYATESCTLSTAMVEKVVNRKIEEHNAQKGGFIRKGQ